MKGVCSLSMASAKGVTKLDGRDVLEMILLVLFLHESTGFMGDLIVHILKTVVFRPQAHAMGARDSMIKDAPLPVTCSLENCFVVLESGIDRLIGFAIDHVGT